ncbi:hypothetical protein MO867_00640 [Microbulbifer sp. OS29]|uniref:Uncharacterized protein n=1 Tax=Microbulbifer okhotskensis TaxID=2926617 RepID=A0A9X2J2T6_9GAMM|nr:hypothetical protein [Microbulbifer okhotskensis]MCO1332832.1 hypothetical protein [Microbulbifer okhotskensis]
MPEWFEVAVIVAFAIGAVFFFAKYRETAAALHESERMKVRLSNDLNRYRDVPRLRALRDALVGVKPLPTDDEGNEHLLLRDADLQLHHLVLRRESSALGKEEAASYTRDGKSVALQELE